MKKIVVCLMALMLVIVTAVPAFAAGDVKSPNGNYKYKVDINDGVGGSADYEFVTEINDAGEQVVHLTSTPKDGYKFDHWVIEGSFVVDGASYTSKEFFTTPLDLTITGDITVTPYFVKIDGTEPTQAGTTVVVQKDTGSSSPKTGSNDAPLYFIILFAAAACGVATFKFVKSK